MINFKNSNYIPLPHCLTIQKSQQHGTGLFATDNIKPATRLGLTHILYDTAYDHVHITWIRTPLGGFINHSENPNCYIRQFQSSIYLERELFTIKPIKIGDELTVYYTLEEYYDASYE